MDRSNIKCLKPIYDVKEYDGFRDLVWSSASKYGDRDAFIIKHRMDKRTSYEHISFEDFRNDVRMLGEGMAASGLKGKNFAIIGNNCYEWILSYITVTGGLGNVIPLDKGLPYEEAESSLIRSYADVLIYDSAHRELADKIKTCGNTGIRTFIYMDRYEEKDNGITIAELMKKGRDEIMSGGNEYEDTVPDTEGATIFIFTSGTTARSKAVMLSQKNIMANIYAVMRVIDVGKNDVSMAFLPYHHTLGALGQFVMIAAGIVTTYCDGLKYIQKNIVEYKVSVFLCVPLLIESIYKRIIRTAEKEGKIKKVRAGMKISSLLLKMGIDVRKKIFREIHENLGGHLRLVISGAASIDEDVLKGLNAFGITAIQGYGMTETSPVLSFENEKERKTGSVGKAVPGVELAIDSPDSEGIGELIAKGPNVMLGYFEDKEETEKVLKDGWLHTGDLARTDEEGYLYICGRKKNVVVLRNGKNVYPEEIETLISKLPYVEENMVFGEEKRKGSGEHDLALAAKIVYKKDVMEEVYGAVTDEDAGRQVRKDMDKINEMLPVYKRINRIVVTDIPMIKTTTGKIKRYEEGKRV